MNFLLGPLGLFSGTFWLVSGSVFLSGNNLHKKHPNQQPKPTTKLMLKGPCCVIYPERPPRTLQEKQTTRSKMAGHKKVGSHVEVTMLGVNVDKASFIPCFTRDRPC